jgi:hypothetical protein
MATLVRLLAVLLAALGLGGAANVAHAPSTVSRVPAKIAHVPSRARSIEIHSALGMTNVTDRSQVRQIVKWFAALPRFRTQPCPYLWRAPADVRFDIRSAKGTSLLRAVDHAPGVCGSRVTVSIDGRGNYAALADNGFVAKVERLLDVSFDANAAKTAANRRAAIQETTRIMRRAILLPGIRRVALAPGRAVSTRDDQAYVDLTRAFVVSTQLDDVNAFEEAHPPTGSHETASGSGGRWGVVTSRDLTFAFPVHRGISYGSLEISMTARADGSTRISVDAVAGWVLARGRDELVPSGVTTIEIRKDSSPTYRFTAPGKVTNDARSRLVYRVTNRRDVGTIIRWFDTLPRPAIGPTPPICSHTAMWSPQPETIAFLDSSGDELARAEADAYGGYLGECAPITFTIHGHVFPLLYGGNFLVGVERLLR